MRLVAGLRLADHTTAVNGIQFGADTNLYRSAAGTVKTDGTVQIGDALQGVAIDPTGRMAIHSGPPTSAVLLNVGTTGALALNSASGVFGVVTHPVNAGVGDTYGVLAQPLFSNAGGSYSYLVGVQGEIRFANATGTLASGVALRAGPPTISAGGIVAAAIGVDIVAQKVAGVTAAWGIYQRGTTDLNLFNGYVGLGVTPTARLHLVADTTAAGGISFGGDTRLYRSAANTLTTGALDATSIITANSGTATSLRLNTNTIEAVGTDAVHNIYMKTKGGGAVAINMHANSGTGGLAVGDGAATPVAVFSVTSTGYTQMASHVVSGGLVQSALGFRIGATGPLWLSGTGVPEGVVSAPVGSQFSRTDGAKRTSLYRKVAGTGTTGWLDEQQAYVGAGAPTGTPAVGDLWYDTDDVSTLVLPMSVASGGTGATTAAGARTTLAMPGEELAYNQITATVNVTATAAATGNLVIEGTSRTYDGSPVIVEFYAPHVTTPSTQGSSTLINLFDGTTDLGYMGQVKAANEFNNVARIGTAMYLRRRITPTAGTHNYRILAWASPTGGEVVAGAGTINTHAPAYIRVIRA